MSTVDLLIFELAKQRYALATSVVKEVVRAVAVQPLPQGPTVIEGVIDLRGQLVPVFDVRARFRLPSSPLSASEHFVLAWAHQRLVALRCDQVLTVLNVYTHAIRDARPTVPGLEHVSGVVTLADGLVLIHDLATFLTEAEAESLDQALQAR